MKKRVMIIVLAAVLVMSGTAFAAQVGGFGGAIKGGVDLNGKWKVTGSPTFGTKTSGSVALEGYYLVHPYVDVGLGAQYLFPREIKTSPGWKFWFLPLYGVVRVHPQMSNITPYAIFQLGYNFHGGNSVYFAGGDKKGGLYWGAGAGVIYMQHFLAEVLYSQSQGKVDPGSLTVTHRRITLSVGYNF